MIANQIFHLLIRNSVYAIDNLIGWLRSSTLNVNTVYVHGPSVSLHI